MSHFLSSGHFSVGGNYWASHAGIAMWRDWRPDIIEKDFAVLASEGLQILRVFPLWPDFQPIELLRSGNGHPMEFRHGEMSLPDDEVTPSGLCSIMLERFQVLADLAASHHLDLIVGLITGWMSGRLFVPPALQGLNPITDPASIKWQVRFAKAFVARFQGHNAIQAWDLGNECNVMGSASQAQAWVWTAGLANAIRSQDSSRPIISGMHSLSVDPTMPWNIHDQGELTDILTTHPYPLFTPFCHREPLPTMRPILHGTAETCLYADIGSKPAFVEEFGNLGPMICGEEQAGAFVRSSLASLWAHDGRAALWWCAHDQTALEYAPYDWIAVERELGLVRPDYSAKPALREIGKFRQFLETLPFTELPRRTIDAVCLLTAGQDQWAVAFSAFVLAKQAGFDIRFHYANRALPDASLYLVPSLAGLAALSRRRENELWERVRQGATAYVSLGDGILGRFAEATGMAVSLRSERRGPCLIPWATGQSLSVTSPVQYDFQVHSAEILATEATGHPVFWRNRFGQGEVFVLAAPLEASLATESFLFPADENQLHWQIYQGFAGKVLSNRIVHKNSPWIGVTEHPFTSGEVAIIFVNYSNQPLRDIFVLSGNYHPRDGDHVCMKISPREYEIDLEANGYAVLLLTR